LADFRRAFTTLVADTQFSTLGVVLFAVLARVGRIVGLPRCQPMVPAANVGSKTLLTSSVRETGPETGEVVTGEYVEDMGSVVERGAEGSEPKVIDTLEAEDVANQPDSNESGENEQGCISVEREPGQNEIKRIDSQMKAKRKRKKGNAIDDLFGDLI
jgi:ribonuclease MRP protein subunit RMP1